MADQGGYIQTIKLVGIFVIAMAIMLAVISPLFATLFNVAGNGDTAAITPQTRQNVSVDGIQSKDAKVKATLGNALYFNGENSAVETGQSANLTKGPWTLCGVATLKSDADQNATYTIEAYNNESILLEYDAGQWSAYFDNGTEDAKATISATDPTTATAVCGRWDGTNLTVSRDGTVSSPETLDNTTDTRNLSSNWYGTLDEIRTFNSSLSDAKIQQYADDPIAPLPNTNRSSRMMFDEGQGTTTKVYFSGVTATIQGASWTDGVKGPGLKAGTDYVLNPNPLRLKALSGGYLEDAPVAYVVEPVGPFYGLLQRIAGIGGSALGLLIVGVLAFAGNKVMDLFGDSGF